MIFQMKVQCFVFILIVLYFPVSKVYAESSWLDLPPDPLVEILYEYDSNLDQLNSLVQKYHAIPKTSWKSIPKRINYLGSIETLSLQIKKHLKSEYLQRIVEKYSKLANEKKQYLMKLLDVKDNYSIIKENVSNVDKIPSKYEPLALNNERKLDFKTQEFWGQYFIEAVDPSHRRLMTSYHEIWSRKYPNQTLPDFFLWLENKNVSLFFPSIILYKNEELNKHQILIRNGKFISKNHQPITTKKIQNTSMFNSEPIFIIDQNEKMYLTYSSNQCAHVSLSHYKPIIGSGKIWLIDGDITKISFESGHYLPKIAHYIQTLKFWESKGVPIDDNIPLTYFKGYREIQTSVGAFKKQYFTR